MRFGVIASNPMITRKANGKYDIRYADPSENWKIKEYHNLSFKQAAKLPFVNKSVLAMVR